MTNDTGFNKYLIVLSLGLIALGLACVAYMATYAAGVLITLTLIVVTIGGMWMTLSSSNIATSVLMIDGIQKGHQLRLGRIGYGAYPVLPHSGHSDDDVNVVINNPQASPTQSVESVPIMLEESH